jgi:hypothetical protein
MPARDSLADFITMRRLLTLSLVLALAGGCSADDPANPEAGAQALAEGSYELELDGGEVRLRANQAPRRAILDELEARAGFELAGDLPGDPFTGWFTAPTAEHAIGLLAPGLAYRSEYRPESNGHRLVRIELSRPAPSQPDDPIAAVEPAPAAATARSVPDTPEPPREDSVAARLYDQWRDDHDYALDLLDSNDPGIRVSALEEFDAEGGGLVALDRALTQEEDPVVRAALLEKLDESGSVIALQSILRGLADPAPVVVVTAIQLAQDWHDEELTERYIEPLLAHPDKRVQTAAREAIDSVRE